MVGQEIGNIRGLLPEECDPFILGGFEGLPRADETSFSHKARELRLQAHPETGEPIELFTRKQLHEQLKKALKEF